MRWVINILYEAIKITCICYRKTSGLDDINTTMHLLEWQVCSLVNCHMPILRVHMQVYPEEYLLQMTDGKRKVESQLGLCDNGKTYISITINN